MQCAAGLIVPSWPRPWGWAIIDSIGYENSFNPMTIAKTSARPEIDYPETDGKPMAESDFQGL
jgi:hypothetical protein